MKNSIIIILFLSLLIAKDGLSLEIIKGPYIQNISQTEATIMWETDRWASAEVQYGNQGDPELGKSKIDENQVRIHEITITKLLPESYYNYKVISELQDGERVESDIYTLRSAPLRDTPFRMVAWGDNRTDSRTCEKVAQLIAAQNPDIVINVGDVVTDGNIYSQWNREYFAPIRHFASSVPSYIAIGNHENDSHWFDDLVSQPGNEHWFSFTYGNSRFIILDTNRPYHSNTEQHEWLIEELNSDEFRNSDFRFAFFHHPPYSEQWDSPGYVGEHKVRSFLVPLFEEYEVDMVFSGHTHDYERGSRMLESGHEIYYVITGGGGSALDRVETKDWDVIELHRSLYHCVSIDVNGNMLEYRAIGLDGEIIDTFSKINTRIGAETSVRPKYKLITTWAGIKS